MAWALARPAWLGAAARGGVRALSSGHTGSSGGGLPHVVVVGAGVIGCATAHYLQRSGAARVTVVDAAPRAAFETSFANAGMVCPTHVHKRADPLFVPALLRLMAEAAAAVPLGLDPWRRGRPDAPPLRVERDAQGEWLASKADAPAWSGAPSASDRRVPMRLHWTPSTVGFGLRLLADATHAEFHRSTNQLYWLAAHSLTETLQLEKELGMEREVGWGGSVRAQRCARGVGVHLCARAA